ncbi:hypothetical protein D3C77_736130 [compost metagenome]
MNFMNPSNILGAFGADRLTKKVFQLCCIFAKEAARLILPKDDFVTIDEYL